MRLPYAAAITAGIALACLMPAGPVTAKTAAKSSAKTATEAADQTLGMALMSVSVDIGGFVMHRAGVQSVTVVETGIAEVVFERSLTGCTVVASATNANPNSAYGLFDVNARRWGDNIIRVQTYNAGALTNRPFSVLAFCSG